MERILKNKKILILIGLVFILILVMLAYAFTHNNNKTPNIPSTPIDSENHEENPGDIYIRDENGNIKNVLVIDTDDYSLNMDLLGTWKEYLLPVDERDKYQAFMIPDKTSEAIPYFYILIEKSPSISSEAVVEEEIIYSLKNSYDSFKLEQISKKTDSDTTKYIVTYNTVKDREETKNYLTIFYKDGYKISFIYSALDIAYASEKGYIDDMISTANFNIK